MKGPTQFYPTHNARFIGETVHRIHEMQCLNARSGAVFHTKYQYSPNSSIYLSILYTVSKRHGKPPLGTAGIVVICLRLFECYSSRAIRKEWLTPYIVGTYVFPLTTIFHVIFVYKTSPPPTAPSVLVYFPHVPVARKSPDGKSDRSRDRFKSYGCIYLFTHTDNKKQIT